MKLKRSILIGTLAALLIFTSAGTSFAQGTPPAPQNPVAAFLAGLAGVPYEQIAGYQQSGYGLGNIGRALAFSQLTGASLDETLARGKEIGWGQMFKEAGLHPGGHGLGSLLHGRQGKDGKPGTGGGPPPWAGGPDKDKGPKEKGTPEADDGT